MRRLQEQPDLRNICLHIRVLASGRLNSNTEPCLHGSGKPLWYPAIRPNADNGQTQSNALGAMPFRIADLKVFLEIISRCFESIPTPVSHT